MTLRPFHLLAALLAFTLAACGNSAPDNGKPKVLSTIFPYYDIIRSVGGDKINAEIVLDPGMEVHGFRASPDDMEKIKAATLIVKNGLALDDWPALAGVKATVLSIGEAVGTDMGPAGHVPPAEAGATNPHVWLDPVKMIKATELIRDALIKMDPDNKSTYEANAEQYLADLKKLDADFAAATKTFSKKSFIGFHEAYEYLAARYGLTQAAALEEMDKTGLTPEQVAIVTKLIKDGAATVVFAEDAASKIKVETVAKGATIGILLPLEKYRGKQDTYVGLMRENLAELQRTMK